MPPHRLHPNSPRKRIAYVKKSMGDRVARATAYVMADTLGEERIFEDEPIESYFDDGPPHPSEALIPWAGQYLAKLLRAVEKGNLSQDEFFERQDDLERVMPQIATWVHHTRPDLTKLSVDEAMQQASAFENPGATSNVPQGEVIYRFADGWTIQNLTTPKQIFADGIHVQNCLREDRYGPSYAAAVKAGETKIFSLRKPSGIPVISIQYNVPGKYFKQIYAKQNTPLGINLDAMLKQDTWLGRPTDARILWENIQQYKPRIAEFLTAFGADPGAFVMAGAPLPAGLTSVGGSLNLIDYAHPLPALLTSVGGSLNLTNYAHPLPALLTSVGGSLNLTNYAHRLPAGLTSVGGTLILHNYNHPLPAGLTSVGGSIDLGGYPHPLPAGLTSVDGSLVLGGYNHPLPARLLASVGGRLDLDGYSYPLPAGLTSVDGSLVLGGYNHPLPAGLTSVGGGLNLSGYNHPLPAGLTSVGGIIFLGRYAYRLPAGLTSVGGYLFLNGYEHPLPAGLTSVGGLILTNYAHPLPALLTSVAGSIDLAGYKHPLPAGLVVGGNISGAKNYPFPLPAAGEAFPGRVDVLQTWTITPNRKRSSRRPRRRRSRSSRRPVRKTSRRTRRTSRK